jgi:hypothetical protein
LVHPLGGVGFRDWEVEKWLSFFIWFAYDNIGERS